MPAAIANMLKYTDRMKRGMFDKTFYLKYMDVNVHFDYGCADGAMIEFIAAIFPDHHFFGYDNDPEMIRMANAKEIHNAIFSTDFNELVRLMNQIKVKKTVLILSSIIHEIYAYLDDDGIDNFWHRVLNSNFDYISIRDMTVAEPDDLIYQNGAKKIIDRADPKILSDFVKRWGPIHFLKNQIHFLLKYRYINNWKRELNEDYLGFNQMDFYEMINFHGQYVTTYCKPFALPFLVDKVKEDFDYNLEVDTHIKIILEKIE